MIVETILGVAWRVEEEASPNGPVRVLVLIDQDTDEDGKAKKVRRVVRIPFDQPVAKQVGAQLSGLVVTRQMPAAGPGVNGGA